METPFLGTDQESPSFFIPISPDIFFVLSQPTCRNIYYYQTSNSLGTSCLMGTGSPTYFPQSLSAFSSHPLCHTLTYRMTLHHIIHSQHTFLRNRESNKTKEWNTYSTKTTWDINTKNHLKHYDSRYIDTSTKTQTWIARTLSYHQNSGNLLQ